VSSDMARQKVAERRGKKRSKSMFPQIEIIEVEDFENMGESVGNDLIVDIMDMNIERLSSRALSSNNGMTTSLMVKENDKKSKLKGKKKS
jgi:hypothetical protein